MEVDKDEIDLTSQLSQSKDIKRVVKLVEN